MGRRDPRNSTVEGIRKIGCDQVNKNNRDKDWKNANSFFKQHFAAIAFLDLKVPI